MAHSITTHVLDTSRGRPAAGVPVLLEHKNPDGAWIALGRGVTDTDGRLREIMPQPLVAGEFRLTFDTAAYFHAIDTAGFFPEVSIVFVVSDPTAHHHVPLLLSPFGFSTYRGS